MRCKPSLGGVVINVLHISYSISNVPTSRCLVAYLSNSRASEKKTRPLLVQHPAPGSM